MNERITEGSNALVVVEPEKSLSMEVSFIERHALELCVASKDDFQTAAEMVKEVKSKQKQIKEYWEPLRISAKAAYDEVILRKKNMLEPLERAEKILKGKMVDYTTAEEKKRAAQEEALRRLAKVESDKKLEEAVQAEVNGDAMASEFAMADAESMEDMAATVTVMSEKVKVDGVSQSRSWKITKIDSERVPVYYGAIELRPVDERAVLRLIKESKGTIRIPGVEYQESVTFSVRA